jgi:predicted RNA-binding Zn ribbon-like protein
MKAINYSSAGEMKLVGGRLFLDFTNTVGGRKSNSASKGSADAVLVLRDKLKDYSDLVVWGQHTGIISETEAQRLIAESKRRGTEAAAVLERAIALREALYHICEAILNGRHPEVAQLAVLNSELLEARSHQRLMHAAEGFKLEWVDSKADLDRLLWPIVRSAAEFLTRGDLSRLRLCVGEDCSWFFEDTSRNKSRQWCDMQACGNLAKVRRFRTRMRNAG